MGKQKETMFPPLEKIFDGNWRDHFGVHYKCQNGEFSFSLRQCKIKAFVEITVNNGFGIVTCRSMNHMVLQFGLGSFEVVSIFHFGEFLFFLHDTIF